MKTIHANLIANEAARLLDLIEEGGDLVQAKFLLDNIIIHAQAMRDELINEGVE